MRLRDGALYRRMHLRGAMLAALGGLAVSALLNCNSHDEMPYIPSDPDKGPGDPPIDLIGVGFAVPQSVAWEGTGSWQIEVGTMGSALQGPVTVTVAIVGGTASGGADYTLASSTITIDSGQPSAAFAIPILDDAAVEPAETLQLSITAVSGAGAARTTHTLTILDNDARAWPGETTAAVVDGANVLGANLSGLTYQAAAGAQPARLWAVKNGPSLLHRLERSGALWAPSTTDGWTAGKTLRYPGGGGSPDAEGVTLAGADAASALYVTTERDNDVGNTSRLSVLRYDPSGAATSINATHEWNLTADLPAVDPNAGFEAITWVSDKTLVARGFRDEKLGKAYAPADYPNHGEGLFLVGLEGNGTIYVYALDHVVAGKFTRLASFASGHASVMALEQDGELLWAGCDNSCNGELTIFTIDDNPSSTTRGRFVLRRRVDRPTGLPNLNDEGIALAPDSACVNKRKPFFWADDGATGGNALRQGSVACGAF